MTIVVAIVYFVIGCGAAASIVVLRRQDGLLAGWIGVVLMVSLWPFLLPVAFFASEDGAGGTTARQVRIRELAHTLTDAWHRHSPGDHRAKEAVSRYVERLVDTESRRADVEAAILRAPESIRDRLVHLERRCAGQVDEGLVLLDDMLAQLTLLRFSQSLSADEDERASVEDLLARMEALISLAPEVPAASADPAPPNVVHVRHDRLGLQGRHQEDR